MLIQREKPFLIGLDWRLAHSRKDAKTLIDDYKKEGIKHRVEVKLEAKDILIGFCSEPLAGRYVASLLLADLHFDGIFVVHLGNDQYWVLVVENGLPVNGHDLILQSNNLTEDAIYQDVLQTFSDLPLLKYGSQTQEEKTSDQFWSDLEFAIDDKEVSKKALRQAYKRKPNYALLITATVMTASVYAYTQLNKPAALDVTVPESFSQPVVKHIISNVSNEKEEREKRLLVLKHEYEKSLSMKLDQTNQKAQFTAVIWHDVYQSLPVIQSGYKPKSLKCDQSTCTVQWQAATAKVNPLGKIDLIGVDFKASSQQDDQAATSVFKLQELQKESKSGSKLIPLEEVITEKQLFKHRGEIIKILGQFGLSRFQVSKFEPIIQKGNQELNISDKTLFYKAEIKAVGNAELLTNLLNKNSFTKSQSFYVLHQSFGINLDSQSRGELNFSVYLGGSK
ncbi:type 4b pilus protein PilO2 [Thiomicrorhabdus indica]|uniref:type 4b pilus protein PilO2 n=1 Tax=Thiomicrorhabdus indica TaxID=2267253 RepID=UPI00102DB10F|nr:type 4b pilus protein PilO2 [Thiomicrorhabdus indica]